MKKNEAAEPLPVAAVIVTFNSAATIHNCIVSLLASPAVAELMVVDNQSTDDTLARVARIDDPRIRVIGMPQNVGFARGVNRGVSETRSPLLAVVNPDTVTHADTIEKLRDALASGQCWAAGPSLLNSRGLRERSARAFPNERNALLNWRYLQIAPGTKNRHVASFLMLDRDLHDTFPCDWLSGAYLLLRRDVFDELGGFDPSYFLYYEDVDLFRRASDRGQVCCYVGATSADHAIGHSSNTIPIRSGLRRVGGFIRYYRTHVRKSLWTDLRLAFYMIAGIVFLEVLAPLRNERSMRHRPG